MVSVTTACAPVGSGEEDATDRICHSPSIGSVTVRSSSPGPVEVSSGEPGPWSAALGLIAKTSRSVGTVLVQVYRMVSLAVLVWWKVAAGAGGINLRARLSHMPGGNWACLPTFVI